MSEFFDDGWSEKGEAPKAKSAPGDGIPTDGMALVVITSGAAEHIAKMAAHYGRPSSAIMAAALEELYFKTFPDESDMAGQDSKWLGDPEDR